MTDADGNIAQHIEYIPYGEVFVEERNSQFSTNFLFNAKELDNETGLYYYGARYLDPMGAMWLSVDPMWEKYAGMSPYNYCAGNPVKLVDVDGRDYVYFKEDGTEIGRITNDNEEMWYAIRTTQSTEEMYKESSPTQKGNTNPISKKDALRALITVKMACDGITSQDDIPMHLFTRIPNQETADASFEFIRDDGTAGTSDNNNREYSFNVLMDYDDRNEYLGLKASGAAGPVMDPSENAVLPAGGHRENHTHSSGVKTVGSRIFSWQQPPSKGDIENCGTGFTGNVWGMRSKTLYIYDKKGVKATIPFSIYGR
ncbi:MAG: RHS repeat-associated core domain-containing protein [Paludibacteraceae bacterium]|nr:RHS repeat-associated core domain-containing protein [Paludibacteraceae bacterium]